MSDNAVKATAEFKRIFDMPRRPTTGHAELARQMTEALRRPGGKQTLRETQALALHDIAIQGGGFLPVGVGKGKTLISLLAPLVLESKAPLLLLPATLIENAERAMRVDYGPHWVIPTNIRIVSYEKLGLEAYAKLIEQYEPDLIVADEAHRLKNLGGAACARRIARWMAANPRTRFVAMSGTVMRDKIDDFTHLLFWALKDRAPLPMDPGELAQWGASIDEPKMNRFGQVIDQMQPGALLQLCSADERINAPITAARLGFRRRLCETPGVVEAAGDGDDDVGASIRITGQVYPLPEESDKRFADLRGAMLTPDGHELLTGVEVWRHARELALGFHSIWDPRPPPEWLEPRKKWGAFVRAYLGASRTLDTPDQVRQGVEAGFIDDDGKLEAWAKVEETYTPNVVEIWHDDSVLKLVAKWAKKSPGIVWTKHVFFADRLAELTGLPYFRQGGIDAGGRYIEDADCSKSIIASIDANRDGKNLQGNRERKWKGFSRNLFVGPPDGWDALQQALGRTHRSGQEADEVTADVMLGCREHMNAWRSAVAGTYAARDTIGGTPKLLLADLSGFPTDDELGRFVGSRW